MCSIAIVSSNFIPDCICDIVLTFSDVNYEGILGGSVDITFS